MRSMLYLLVIFLATAPFTPVLSQEITKELLKERWETDQLWIKENYLRRETNIKKSKDFKTGAFKNKEKVTRKEYVFIDGKSYFRIVEGEDKNKFEATKDSFDWTVLMERFKFSESQFEEYAPMSFHRIQVEGSKTPKPTNHYEEVASEMAGELKVTSLGAIMTLYAYLNVDKVKVSVITVEEMTIDVVTQTIEGRVVPMTVTVDYHVHGLKLVKKRYREITEYSYIKMSPQEQAVYYAKYNGKPKA